MRQYRGLTKEGKWVYGHYVVEGCKKPKPHFIVEQGGKWNTVIPETVGQFIGLKDNNGKELDWWEGDVFELHGRSTLFTIIKEQGCFWFRSSITKERFPCYQIAKWVDLPEKLGDSQTIFSQNPELMESKDDSC
jgi:hypothetical protein